MDGPSIAIVGATGAVGRELLRILEQRDFPAREVRLCASERSWGKMLLVNGREVEVEEATPRLLSQVDIAFFAAGADVSLELAPVAVDQGTLVVDKSSAFRMDPDVPLVVPEVNGDDLANHRGIVASPNCSTTPLVMVLKPLQDTVPVMRVIADTYQSVSGAGGGAMEELQTQTEHILEGRGARSEALPHQIAMNVLPHIDAFHEDGYTEEETKMVNETHKILHLPDLPISATCVRVPVMVSHSEAVHVELAEPISPDTVRELLSEAPGVRVVDDPESNRYPMPIDAAGMDEVYVGRIRRDASHPNGIAMWVSCDNLRKGAALNAIQIAEEVLARNLLLEPKRRV